MPGKVPSLTAGVRIIFQFFYPPPLDKLYPCSGITPNSTPVIRRNLVLQQLDEDVYRGLKHMNQSVLKNGLRSMQHLRAAVNGELPYKETPALA